MAKGQSCATHSRGAPIQTDCTATKPSASFRDVSERVGQKFCAHPEAKETRALFCRYPPRFYGHQGVCRQYSQFCPFQELQVERDAERVETAVVNVDAQLFGALESCGVLREEIWIFKVFVHWCPHCQQLMPRLYRLAFMLQRWGVRQLRFGAINCATEHDLCASQKWPGHPLLVVKYLGIKRHIHDAIEHWVNVVKDAQLRAMLPRYAVPGEYPLLKLLLEQLPEEVAPPAVWKPLFDDEASAQSGACPNVTAMHPTVPSNVDEVVGNAWSDGEADVTPRKRWTDALLSVQLIFQEWIAPLGDDGNVHAFSYQQVLVMESWVELLTSNLPPAFGILDQLLILRRHLRARLRDAQAPDGGCLCVDEWREWTAPLMKRVADVGQQNFSVSSACLSDTCRFWSLLHTIAAQGHHRQLGFTPAEENPTSRLSPNSLLTTVHGFIQHFFKCLYCRRHFLEQFDMGSYGLGQARTNTADTVLYFWRLHNAVSVRVAAEHGCADADRRWPPISLCPQCWETRTSNDWPILAESLALRGKYLLDEQPLRWFRLKAIPEEFAILQFLINAFIEERTSLPSLAR